VVAAARLKVLAALPTELRARASRLVERFHLDAAGWFHATDPVPHLGVLADAVWEAKRVTVGYRRAGGEVNRIIDPLGLVLKAGVWYLVAATEDQIRTYRVSRFSRVTPHGATFTRPAGFDLAEHWRSSIAAYEESTPRMDLEVRVAPHAIGLLAEVVGGRAVRSAERLGPPDPDGWQRLRLTVDWPEEVPTRMVAMGDRLEVLEPAEVRAAVLSTAERVVSRYRALS
jgi:predicted DNA-binding transcriptional regulator YafY